MDDPEVELDCGLPLGEFIRFTQKTTSPLLADWNKIFGSAGYHGVRIVPNLKRWPEIHQWCQDNIGPEHYAWCGMTVFWFETSRTALLFSLKWL